MFLFVFELNLIRFQKRLSEYANGKRRVTFKIEVDHHSRADNCKPEIFTDGFSAEHQSFAQKETNFYVKIDLKQNCVASDLSKISPRNISSCMFI